MPLRLPPLSGNKVINALESVGFERVRQHGSHVTLVNRATRRTVPVPVHGTKALKPGTLMGIIHQAGLTRAEFLALLK